MEGGHPSCRARCHLGAGPDEPHTECNNSKEMSIHTHCSPKVHSILAIHKVQSEFTCVPLYMPIARRSTRFNRGSAAPRVQS